MKYYFLCMMLVLGFSGNGISLSFDKVIIWGHKLHSHTHSYVHEAFYKTFRHLGYDTYWFDDVDDVSEFNFENALFITEGQADKNIPIIESAYYILHHCDHTSGRYLNLFNKNHIIALEVYSNDVLGRSNVTQIEPCIYYDLVSKVVYMPWATDLLPFEIDEIKKQMPHKKLPIVYWVGTVGGGYWGNINQVSPFALACRHNEIDFLVRVNVDSEDHIGLIQQSYMAPTIVGEGQEKIGYIPCRIFKNISYGQMGITNSKSVYELFEKKIVYNPDTYQLFFDAQKHMETFTLHELFELMDFVKEKHTYINRIERLLEFLSLVVEQNQKGQ